MKRSKKKSLKKAPVFLLVAAAVLLLASTVGSTQAALTYYSDNYSAQVTVSNIGVTLLENGSEISRRNYIGGDKLWDTTTGNLLTNMLSEGEKLVLGKDYTEKLTVKNSGAIDSYVRVILTKSWQYDPDESDEKEEYVKDTELTPAYIELNVPEGNGWIKDEAASTVEREVYYYTRVLPADNDKEDGSNVTPALTNTFRINPAVAKELIQTTKDKIITYEYKYDGYQCVVEAEVDTVQTHNAADAIKSAWGIDVAVAADGSISLK